MAGPGPFSKNFTLVTKLHFVTVSLRGAWLPILDARPGPTWPRGQTVRIFLCKQTLLISNISFIPFFAAKRQLKVFLEGVRGNHFFQKKVPPEGIVKIMHNKD